MAGILHSTGFPVPVIVVGNITVGGSGKTPLVGALVHWLQAQGFKPGIVSRLFCITMASMKHNDKW